MDTLSTFSTPQLKRIHRGKVRDSYRVDPGTRLIVVTDRISAFDRVLESAIPGKGAVLNGLSNHWFALTRDIVDNHLIEPVDPQATLVREAVPFRVEMVVRGYIAGSMWRSYQAGRRAFWDVTLPDGLHRNQRLPAPLLTPTTKEESDREITREEILRSGLADADTYTRMEEVALRLFARGTERLAERGVVLVDTKYEFGLCDGRLTLIDEIHTPDSSRFWEAADHARDPERATEFDKEFVRQWLLARAAPDGTLPATLPPEIVAETSRRYAALHERIVGAPPAGPDPEPAPRLLARLVRRGILRDGFVAIVVGSPADLAHAEEIRGALGEFGVFVEVRVVSAHKNGDDLVRICREYGESLEPGAVVAVAGLSNGLGGALAFNLNLPVINCPPFQDRLDLLLNVNSSLLMPSQVPAATVIGAKNGAWAALRALNLPRLRLMFDERAERARAALRENDERARSGCGEVRP